MSYVDLHLHLLPGVDDGAQDEHDALVHARRLAVEGVREVTVTPHISPSWPLEVASIPGRVAALQKAIDKRSLGVRLHAGGEIHPRSAAGLTDDELEILANGPPGSRWLLLEAPFGGVGDHFIGICDGLRARGFGLVIAHPERAGRLLDDGGVDLLRTQLHAGAVLQINVCSLLGNHGLSVQETAVHLLRSGLAYAIASDGHPGSRSHTLRLGFELAMRAGASSVAAWRLTQANPRFLLHQGIPQTPSPATTAALELMLD
ncbi:MAG TPA: CpsB/CapC family capsule biosynthesis tyrosine phosphatase [Solirubrobacteraceae bacterium]